MEQHSIREAIGRIEKMEQAFDLLQTAIKEAPAAVCTDASLREALRSITQYYESGDWLRDYELDEKGLLPQALKRGVLSQDAVYDLLGQVSRAD